MPKYLIAVCWEECGEFIVEAPSLAEAKEAVEEHDDLFSIGKAGGEYVDGSFSVNSDCCRELTEVEAEREDAYFVNLSDLVVNEVVVPASELPNWIYGFRENK